jgi:signal transduction histidine kinase/CheY-like chemotaxis protein
VAWLELVRAEFYLSVERNTRAVPLCVTAMGLVVIATLSLQRRAALGREQALRAAAVAAESNRVKTTFLAKVSHELRTPVQSLLGYGELLRGRLDGDAQAGAWLDAIQQHGTLMIRLVNDLLDLGAVEAGTFRLMPRQLDPAGLVRESVASLRAAAAAKQLALRCDIGPGVPLSVEADGERLRQLVLNLAGNAVKFTDRGAVDVALVATPVAPGRVRLTLTVRDTGPGIPAAARSALFTAFSRLPGTAHKEGSGLGLALCLALCRAMHGTLSVEDNLPAGCCFTATLTVPLAAAALAPTGAPVPSAPVLAGCRVLVVDDNRLVRELFATALAERGALCRTAASLAEAAAAIRHEIYGAAVLDLALPDGNGASLVPPLRHAAPGIRIVGVSAHADPGERQSALAAGMDAFLTKPVTLGELAATLAGRAPVPADDQGVRAGLLGRLEVEFRREAPGRRAELAAAIAAGEWQRAKATAHYLANSASVVRDRELLDACITLVRASTTADRPVIHASWSRCEGLLGRWLEPPVSGAV